MRVAHRSFEPLRQKIVIAMALVWRTRQRHNKHQRPIRPPRGGGSNIRSSKIRPSYASGPGWRAAALSNRLLTVIFPKGTLPRLLRVFWKQQCSRDLWCTAVSEQKPFHCKQAELLMFMIMKEQGFVMTAIDGWRVCRMRYLLFHALLMPPAYLPYQARSN